MLPRLRFVFAAALIAALPWILLGSGIISTAENSTISEHPRPNAAVTVAAGDLRDAYHMHILAYVRRARELERLRDGTSPPLSAWLASPTGARNDDHVTRRDEPREAPSTIVAALPAETVAAASPPDTVAATPPENPAPPPKTNSATAPQPPSPDPAPQAESPAGQSAPEVTGTIQPELNPPLPHARPAARANRRGSRTKVATLPPDAAATEDSETVDPSQKINSDVTEQPASPVPPAEPNTTPDQSVLEVTNTVQPVLNPPLPHARPAPRVRRARIFRPNPRPNGPFNPLFAQKYSTPHTPR